MAPTLLSLASCLQTLSGALHRQCYGLDPGSGAWVSAAVYGSRGPAYCDAVGVQANCGPGLMCLDKGYVAAQGTWVCAGVGVGWEGL